MPKKQQKPSKAVVFSVNVIPINSGLASNNSKFTTREVETLSKPRNANQDKQPKPIPTKVHGNMIAFNSKIRAGNKVKKELKYENIVLVEQLLRDNRVVFVHYVKKKAVYYFVLQFETDSQAVKFLELVANCNPKVMVRKPNKDDDDDDDDVKTIDDGSFVLLNGDSIDKYTGTTSTISTVYDPNIDLSKRYVPRNTEASTPLHTERAHSRSTSRTKHSHKKDRPISKSPEGNNKKSKPSTRTKTNHSSPPRVRDGVTYTTINGTPVVETYISMGEDELYDNDSDFKNVMNYTYNSPFKAKNKASSRPGKCSENFYTHSNDGSKYIYVGLEDEEDDLSSSVIFPRSNSNHFSIQSYSDFECDDQPLEYIKRSSRNAVQTPRGERRHSRRPKSRQLPLSEGETKKSGWHSDIIFITPDQHGGAKISADGPVMLYTASKANNDSDEDDYSSSSDSDDDDDDESYTSSTLTVNCDQNYRTMINGH